MVEGLRDKVDLVLFEFALVAARALVPVAGLLKQARPVFVPTPPAGSRMH